MRKTKSKKRSLPITKKRIRIMSVAFLVFLSLLLSNIFRLQILSNEYYKEKVYDQITTSTKLVAERGKIYDANMNVLAATNTVWRIFISTRDIKKAEKETKTNYSQIIASGLSAILKTSYDRLLSKIESTNVLDVTVKKNADENEYNSVLDFIKKNSLERLVFTEAQNTRYYPNGTMLAHVLGFTGSDSQGLYGLEYFYDEYLKGKDGYYLYAKDANGNALDTEYSTYVKSEAGYNLVTTIDSYVQKALEYQLELTVKANAVTNRATGVVMDVNTGAILAMATTSPFDPNNPYTLDTLSQKKLDSCGYDADSSEYKELKKKLLETMWSNKAVSEAYEPGSTFKIVTVSTALETKTSSVNDRFSCVGHYNVGGYRIRCHKITGHGSGFTLAYGLQMSCNPTMMQIAERIGAKTFYKYIDNFGYFQKSGIDLPSEARTIFHKEENIGSTELATISFGQRFKVSVINHLRAVAAVANGGNLVTPYIVQKITDNNGNTVYEQDTTQANRILSEDTARTVSQILEEGVSGDGGAKNAGVAGYKIAAKTGTSQKFDILDENGNSYLRISSTVAYNVCEEGGIATIIVVDEPQGAVKYGSVVAAPYVSALLSDILPYLGFTAELEGIEKNVPSLVGKPVSEATEQLKKENFPYEVVGNGTNVIKQTPDSNDKITSEHTKIILYTTEATDTVTVPSLVGKELSVAVIEAINAGLNINILNAMDYGTVTYQSLPYGAIVEKGTVITLRVMVYDFED